MTILETNVLSELMRPKPSSRVVAWFAKQPATELFTTSITEAEIFIARVRSAKLATRNVEDFEDCGVGVVDPSNGA
jgi:predicted nucleic acid-binding protein